MEISISLPYKTLQSVLGWMWRLLNMRDPRAASVTVHNHWAVKFCCTENKLKVATVTNNEKRVISIVKFCGCVGRRRLAEWGIKVVFNNASIERANGQRVKY